MPRFNIARPRRTGRPVRPMDWECAQANLNFAGLPNSKGCDWLIDPLRIQENYTDPTLMATRAWGFHMHFGPVQSAAAGYIGVGLIAWNYASNLAPASTDCPGPLSDCDLDWIVRWVTPVMPVQIGAEFGLLAPVVFDLAHAIRSRRRLGNDRSILIAGETDNVSGGAYMAYDIRMLIKE